MKESEEDRLKCVVYESTRAPLRGPPSPMGKAAIRGYRFSRHNAFPKGKGEEEAASPPKKEANPASLRSAAPSKGRGSRGHSLLPMEGGAPKGQRLDGGSGVKETGDCLKCAIIREHPIHRFSRHNAFPKGKAKRRRLRRPKRKPTPPRCARQPLPREGARVVTPSFLWKEVPRRGGGWMGEAG